jgi:hypothetical protein
MLKATLKDDVNNTSVDLTHHSWWLIE